ncbi:RNA polymerase sigma factor [Calditrichota bacterium]
MNDDWESLSQARSGSEDAWNQLIHRHAQRLYNLAVMITRSSSTANDVVQETYLRLINSRQRHEHGSFKSYLSQITYHLALKEVKRVSRHSDLDNHEFQDDRTSPMEELIHGDRQKFITRGMKRLSMKHRNIIALRFFGGLSYAEIAMTTNSPLGTVKSTLFYAVRALRKTLIDMGAFE